MRGITAFIGALALIAIFGGILVWNDRDATIERGGQIINVSNVYIDPATGCHYLKSSYTYVPRMRSNGTQLCEETKG